MAEITPQKVKELREKTGAGMGDCKKALVDAEGDMQQAIEILRKKGAASAAKRAERAANEGLIIAKTSNDGTKAIIVEVNCETDFVARNEEFDKYVNTVADTLLANDIKTIDELMKTSVDGDTIEGMHNEILAKFSENIQIRRFDVVETEGHVAEYIHAGNKLAVVVEIDQQGITEDASSMLRDIAMQIAAMNPQFIHRENVDDTTLRKEMEIYRQQAIDSGKKEEIADRIAQGRLDKFYQENCLVEQQFVKDPKKTVSDVLKEIGKEVGKDVKVKSFKRFFLGEVD
ncbi:MAG: translation elongation factor Ts [Candidatus Kapaibacterium sp.]